MKLAEIAKLVTGKLNGDPELEVSRIARIEEAESGDITWFSHPRYRKWLNKTHASCIIVPKGMSGASISTIELENPSLAIAKLLQEFYPKPIPQKGISKLVQIDATAKIGKGVSIGAFVYIGKDSVVGNRVTIFPHVYIGDNVAIGDDTHIYPNVTIEDNVVIGNRVIIYSGAVIGSDGFAYTRVKGKHERIPHCGGVILEDDVEIGALSTVDRAVIGNTIIKKGTKIDNLVHIAHNVVIGEHSIIVAQVGIAGSTRIGKNVTIAGQAGLTDHLIIGDNVVIGAQAGVTKDVRNGMTVSGYPARPHLASKKAYGLLIKLPELFKRVRRLERGH
ncbi:MAG: UDP-3-O-(3-hydroxymyristoyl)glucosamine N-acyltransferase [bacterium]|nr:UDP-3-O-(3-hydroxymyristoyl)glucosamine N-acyltransferase [bacterium]